jgi:peroxiredoxin Q/BCP
MLKVGAVAPPFVGRTADGRGVRLEDLAGRPVIVYFFHKAFTPNCTFELKGFRDNYDDLLSLGFEVVGVSSDTLETQCRFAARYEVQHPMVSDQDLEIARRYDVVWPLIPFARRVAYVVDHHHKIVAVFRHEFQVSRHLDEILRFAEAWAAARRAGAVPSQRRLP